MQKRPRIKVKRALNWSNIGWEEEVLVPVGGQLLVVPASPFLCWPRPSSPQMAPNRSSAHSSLNPAEAAAVNGAEPERDIWSSILQQVQQTATNKLPSNKSILVLGAEYSLDLWNLKLTRVFFLF